MFTRQELAELKKAAEQAGLAASIYARVVARRGELVVGDAAKAA
jgi:hypothetical protein